MLGKAGALAAAQKQPATILVSALGRFPLPEPGLVGRRAGTCGDARAPENLTVGAGQPYSVAIRVAE